MTQFDASLLVPTERYVFHLDRETLTVPRLGVGAVAIVLDGLDRKSGGAVAVKFIQQQKGVLTQGEIETRERFFDQEIDKIKALSNDPFLLEYLDDQFLRHGMLVTLKAAPGQNAYQISMSDPDELGGDVGQILKRLNEHLANESTENGGNVEWMEDLYELRAALRKACVRAEGPAARGGQLLNGQRFLITQQYQSTLNRLLIQQPNLTTEERLEILLELVKACKQLHSIGITHGDLCPDNIMFKLSLQRDRELIAELREEGIPTRYLYEMQTVLIDLGRVVKEDLRGSGKLTVGLPLGDGNNRLTYAAMEVAMSPERLPFERYSIQYENNELVLYPIWEFEDMRGDDELLGELTRPSQGPSSTAGEGVSHGRRLQQHLEPGDILFNSAWGFTVKNARDERIVLNADEVYRFDHDSRMLVRVSLQELLNGGTTLEFDDVLSANYQQAVPADLFALGITIVETMVGHRLAPGVLRAFSDRCKTLAPGRRLPQEVATDEDLVKVYEEFKRLDLQDLFVIVLRSLVRGDPLLGYYCRSHADISRTTTIRLLRDFTEFTQRFMTFQSDEAAEARLRELNEQLERYKQVLGPDVERTTMYKDISNLQEQLDKREEHGRRLGEELRRTKSELEQTWKDLNEANKNLEELRTERQAFEETMRKDAEARTTRLTQERDSAVSQAKQERDEAVLKSLEEKEAAIRQVQEDKQTAVAQLEQAKAGVEGELAQANQTIESLRSTIESLEADVARLSGELESARAEAARMDSQFVGMRETMAAFTAKYGTNFRKRVKGWFSRKHAAAMVQSFHEALLPEEAAKAREQDGQAAVAELEPAPLEPEKKDE